MISCEVNMNRLANCLNPYQGSNKKVLCVCSAGLLRSPTTAKVLAEEYNFNTRAVGVVPEYALIPLEQILVVWADELVFMEEGHYEAAKKVVNIPPNKLITILGIPDSYSYNDPALVSLIKKHYRDPRLQFKIKEGELDDDF